eukprot:4690870-Pyramimonas_sp.AAC.1
MPPIKMQATRKRGRRHQKRTEKQSHSGASFIRTDQRVLAWDTPRCGSTEGPVRPYRPTRRGGEGA